MTRLHDGLAAGVAGQAMLTKYPLGLYKAIPLRQHLMADKITGGLLLTAAALMDEEPCEARSSLAGTGLLFLVAGFCTKLQGPVRQGHAVEDYAETRRPDAASAGEHRAMSPTAMAEASR